MRLRSVVALMMLAMTCVVLLNMARINPAVRRTEPSSSISHDVSTTHAPRSDRNHIDGVLVHSTTTSIPSVGHNTHHDTPSTPLSWVYSNVLQRASHSMLYQQGSRLLDLFDKSRNTEVNHGGSIAVCQYFRADRKLEKVDYSHRVKRKHEYSTMGLYKKVKDIATPNHFFEFGPTLPVLVNAPPIQLSAEFDLTEPFGSWSTTFFPLNKTITSKHAGASKHNALWTSEFQPPQRVDQQPPAFVGLFRGAIVSHGHVVTCGGEVLSAGGCLWDFHLPAMTSSKEVHRELVAIALCDEWCKGYYHFTHEHLPRVAAVHRLLLERNESRLVLSHSPTGFQRQFLTDILGIPAEQIIHGKAVLGDTVVYPTPMRCGNSFTNMLYLIRRIVYERMDLGEGPTLPAADGVKLQLLFAERKHLSRMPSNYAALKQQLMADFANDFNYETTQGDTTARQQIEMFHRADVVVGPHGANLANMMWMRHGTHVVEMASRRKGNMCYYATASRINVTHHLVLHNKGKDAAYTLEYNYLKQHVAYALAAIRRSALSLD